MDTPPMLRDGALSGRVIVVTGGGTGLGRRIAEGAARLGARLCLASRDIGHLAAAGDAIRAAGGEALEIETDVRDYRKVRALVAKTVRAYGRVDALVNN